ncbi:MAG TPA: arginine--tRNA ligase [Polyangiaceae bacterium]
MSIVDRLRAALSAEIATLAKTGQLGKLTADTAASATFTLERPKRAEHGDYATNAAMVLTKLAGMPPRAIADALVKALVSSEAVASADVAGPGFVNLRIKPALLHAELDEILRLGNGYGRAPSATRERIDVEFVSANPTGPLLVSHGRGAVYGDAVARLLEATGNRVVREYYINDFGNQVRLFAESVRAVAASKPVPEGGYQGDYVREVAEHARSLGALEKSDAELARTCVMLMMRGIRKTLAGLGVRFDVWFSESSLHEWGAVGVALEQLRAGNYLVEKDGATFFVGKGDQDDKDRVVRKSDGVFTYFASDIAYHADKISRGYDRLVNVLGADHHGYVARIKNSLEALGLPADRFEALLFQLVFIYRNGELVKSSKRAGNIVTIDELTDEIDAAAGRSGAGADALRFYYLSRSANTNVEFDVELAKKNSLDNPVFYVQYGHARLCSILRVAADLGVQPGRDFSRLTGDDELALVRKLADYTQIVTQAAEAREPHRVLFFVQELARDFQSYYTLHKSDPIVPPKSLRESGAWRTSWDTELMRARLGWVDAMRTVYASALGLLGISAPERMDRPEVGDSVESGAEEG